MQKIINFPQDQTLFYDYDYFKNPWCPLFGNLPKIKFKVSLQSDCIEIIQTSRDLWGVKDTIGDDNYPDPEKAGRLPFRVESPLSWCPAKPRLISSARSIYSQIQEIFSYAQQMSRQTSARPPAPTLAESLSKLSDQPRSKQTSSRPLSGFFGEDAPEVTVDKVPPYFLMDKALYTTGVDYNVMKNALYEWGVMLLFSLYGIFLARKILKMLLVYRDVDVDIREVVCLNLLRAHSVLVRTLDESMRIETYRRYCPISTHNLAERRAIAKKKSKAASKWWKGERQKRESYEMELYQLVENLRQEKQNVRNVSYIASLIMGRYPNKSPSWPWHTHRALRNKITQLFPDLKKKGR